MPLASTSSRYARLSRAQALLVLTATLLGIVICLRAMPPRTLVPKSYRSRSGGDLELYEKVTQRLHRGEPYYDALGAELRAEGRPTRSVFNWRTPLHLAAVAVLPSIAWATAVSAILAFGGIVLMFFALIRGGAGLPALVQPLLMFGSLLPCFGPVGPYFAELWAGGLIAVSCGVYAFGRYRAGAAAGILALFIRELALPYALVGTILAWRQRRRPELMIWSGGIAAWAVYMTLHAWRVSTHLTPADLPNPASWVQFGGAGFLLRASSIGWMLILPPWVTALYLPFAILGIAAWDHPVGQRMLLTAAAYIGAFSVVGHSVNLYWGALYAPLLGCGIPWLGYAFRDLLGSVLRSHEPATAVVGST